MVERRNDMMFEFELCVAAVSGSSREWGEIWMIVDRGVTLCDWIADLISWSKDAMI